MSNSNRFSMIPRINMPRSSFDLSYNHKTTINAGKLYPVCVQEVLPGDSFKIDCSSVVRLASALVSPMMDNLEVKMEWFFVPNRLVWDHWQNMMGEQESPDDSIDYLVPTFSVPTPSASNLEGSVLDYLGIPPITSSGTVTFNLLPLRAYWKIWQDWFRDENLEESQLKYVGRFENTRDFVPIFARTDASLNKSVSAFIKERVFRLAPRAKKHDYFTSALPWPQKGPGVELPLGETAPIVATGQASTGWRVSDNSEFYVDLRTSYFLRSSDKRKATFGVDRTLNNGDPHPVKRGNAGEVVPDMVTDLSSATSVTINSLRQAFQLQKYYETLARGGSRYTEIIRSFFGVVSPDARLQRSEYLGGYSFPLMIATVPQNSQTTSTSPQGNLAAFGMASNFNRAFSRSFTEHGFVIGLASVVSKPQYQQGLHRMYSRRGRLDYYWPTFAHLGEQAILNKEIYLQGTSADNDVFGYQERFAEYRFNSDVISGQMRSTSSLTLDSYHLAQKFSNLPTLSSDFIRENPPIDRVVAVTSQTGSDQFIADFYFDIKAVRVMPVYGVPGLVDHF